MESVPRPRVPKFGKNWDKGENDKKRGKRKVIGTELYLERKRNNFKFTPKYSARFGYELKQSLEN